MCSHCLALPSGRHGSAPLPPPPRPGRLPQQPDGPPHRSGLRPERPCLPVAVVLGRHAVSSLLPSCIYAALAGCQAPCRSFTGPGVGSRPALHPGPLRPQPPRPLSSSPHPSLLLDHSLQGSPAFLCLPCSPLLLCLFLQPPGSRLALPVPHGQSPSPWALLTPSCSFRHPLHSCNSQICLSNPNISPVL